MSREKSQRWARITAVWLKLFCDEPPAPHTLQAHKLQRTVARHRVLTLPARAGMSTKRETDLEDRRAIGGNGRVCAIGCVCTQTQPGHSSAHRVRQKTKPARANQLVLHTHSALSVTALIRRPASTSLSEHHPTDHCHGGGNYTGTRKKWWSAEVTSSNSIS